MGLTSDKLPAQFIGGNLRQESCSQAAMAPGTSHPNPDSKA